jgi:hypothetical protein
MTSPPDVILVMSPRLARFVHQEIEFPGTANNLAEWANEGEAFDALKALRAEISEQLTRDAEPDSQRPSRLLDAEHGVITGSPGIAKSKGAQSKAAVVADKMAKAARKAVDTHEEESE